MKKRILILGAGNFQLPLIELAKQEGHYVITTDYLPDNPGHVLADEHHDVSTTDKASILTLARDLKIDAIATFSSDPAMPTVAYVAQNLNLPGPSIESIALLTQKDLFRQTLKKLGLNTPSVYSTADKTIPDNLNARAVYVVKPVDSCGSKGVTVSYGSLAQIEAAVKKALKFSSSGRVIVEDYIDGSQVHGDGFMADGHLIHFYLGDHFFFTKNKSFIPISTRWPTRYGGETINEIKNQIERVTREAGYLTGPVNIEARVTKDEKVYLVEIGPRNGGNYVPIIQERLTGFNYLKGALDCALGQLDLALITAKEPYTLPGAHFVLHADKKEIYAGLEISPKVRPHIFFHKEFKCPGDAIEEFTGSHNTLGVVLLEFDSVSQRDEIMNQIQSLINAKYEPSIPIH